MSGRPASRAGAGRSDRAGTGGSLALAAAALVCLLPARPATASFVLSEPSSPVYWNHGLAAAAQVWIEKDSVIAGDLHSNGDIDIKNGSIVAGDASAGGSVGGGGSISGTVTEGVGLVTLPAPLSEAAARALADRIFEGGVTFASDEVVNDLVFVAGTARFRGAVNGTGTVIATGDIRFDNVTQGAPVGLDPGTRLSVMAGGDILIGKGRPLRGVFLAGQDVDCEKEVDIEGVLVAGDTVRLKKAARLTFVGFDEAPPVISSLEPPDGAILTDPTPAIGAAFADNLSGVDLDTFALSVDGIDRSTGAQVDVSGFDFSPDQALAAGPHTVVAAIADHAGNVATASWGFTVETDDTTAPSLAIVSPAKSLIFGDATPAIGLEYGDSGSGLDLGSLQVAVDLVDIVGGCQVGPAAASCEPPELARGSHAVFAEIADLAGNRTSASASFILSFPLDVEILEPEEGLLTNQGTIHVSGDVAEDADSVVVNAIEATLGAGTFSADLTLHEGVHTLLAVARDAAGNVGTASRQVTVDTTPPRLSIVSPEPGTTVRSTSMTVTGLVNDLTIGTVNQSDVTVTVNGVPATVANRSFVAEGVALTPGPNTLTAVATDRAGNVAAVEAVIELDEQPDRPRLQILSGDGQAGGIGMALAAPLVVEATDPMGLPMAGVPVVFRVVQGNGSLDGERRAVIVTTDAQGRASASWTLGTRAGAAANRVRATSPDIPGEATFSAVATAGAPAKIFVASGDNQRGGIGLPPPLPLTAVVLDAGNNPLEGVPVTFEVVTGGGALAGAASVIVETGSSGLARTRLTLGPQPGLDNNRVDASFAGLAPRLPASFKASGFVIGDPADTRITGVVLDNQGAPVPGVTVGVLGTSLATPTDEEGQFRLTGVPVGRIFLVADGSTATLPGEWASLEFEMFTLAGVENTLEKPIYILPIDVANGVFVSETQGGVATLRDIPGFALEVAPGSVTFPGGGTSGVVSVTAVHADKIPMAPGSGMQPRLIVTIQPAGAHFDPPAPITLPNVDSLPAGTVIELHSFDHDLGAFVTIGTGTVAEDRTSVRSDPGFGILKAGWHHQSSPDGSGDTASIDVILLPDPIEIQYGGTAEVTAKGRPPECGRYFAWEVELNVLDNFVSFRAQPTCDGADECANVLESRLGVFREPGTVCGTATAEVAFACRSRTAQGAATITQGCCEATAAECGAACDAASALGMCGTPCDLCGLDPPPFDPVVHSCWKVNVDGTWFCYYDITDPPGPGFGRICCPNRCDEGASARQWVGTGNANDFNCTAAAPCQDPMFGGRDPDDDEPGLHCLADDDLS